jgi:hypothetical protein
MDAGANPGEAASAASLHHGISNIFLIFFFLSFRAREA